MSDVLAKAIIETTRAIGTLGKNNINPHGNYRFVGIDKFYETVASVAAKNGLTWTLRETDFQFLPSIGKTAGVQITYAVDLIHESGQFHKDYSRVTLLHPVQGAQTVGSAMSYACKVFARQTFKVATGEKDSDADETNPSDVSGPVQKAAPKKQDDGLLLDDEPPARPLNTEHAEAIFMEFVPTCQNEDELRQFWADNYQARNILKDHDPEALKRVTAAFAARKNEIKKEAK